MPETKFSRSLQGISIRDTHTSRSTFSQLVPERYLIHGAANNNTLTKLAQPNSSDKCTFKEKSIND